MQFFLPVVDCNTNMDQTGASSTSHGQLTNLGWSRITGHDRSMIMDLRPDRTVVSYVHRMLIFSYIRKFLTRMRSSECYQRVYTPNIPIKRQWERRRQGY